MTRAVIAATPEVRAFVEAIGSGVAAFAGPASPMNKMIGVGFEGAPSERRLREIEGLFERRKAPLQAELATLADPAFAAELTRRGYVLRNFENVSGRPIVAADRDPPDAHGIRVDLMVETEATLWIDAAITGLQHPDGRGVPGEGPNVGPSRRGQMGGGMQQDDRDQQKDAFRIRLARPDEVERLREIEDAAGVLFAGLALIDEALDVSFPLDDLARLVGMGQAWVGCLADGSPVGMVIASIREGAVYIEEMDVLPGHGRRGLGARLLACVCAWAKGQGHPAVTLSTFRDVPWNGPFYRKHGFRDLLPAEWTPGMQAIRAREAQHGLRVEARVFMRREVAG